ncbi:MAG: DUF2007 domain-containing protein [Lachnospiraceae bacterium]|nr:DUF2007 domain-containing protein [Lachnospiraceae bacterium]
MSNNLNDVKIIKIYNARDDIEAGMIAAALEEYGIYCHIMESGSGDWLKITQGFSVFGQDIYVKEQDADKASAIIQDIVRSYETEETPFESIEAELEADDTLTNESINYPWFRNKRLLTRIFIIVFVVLTLITFLLANTL